MKSVYLNYTSSTNEFYVTEEDYWNVIRPLVMKLRICATCKQYYDPDSSLPRPCVGLRICLQCFLQKHPQLQLLEVKSVNDAGETTYTFIDQEGQVYTSRENYSSEPSQDISYSLKQHHFVLPERYKPNKASEEIQLSASHFTLYGDLQTASVLVADYVDSADKIYVTFLLYKNGGDKELTKRREGKVLLERAEAMLQRTRLPNGEYLIDGRRQSKIWEGDIYKVISQMESAVYNISMQFALPMGDGQPDQVEESFAGSTSEPLQREEERPRRGRRSTRLQIVPSQESTSEPIEMDAEQEQIDPTRVIGEISTSEVPTE
jgi:hypothetical protein